jgi:hypothetical protein
MFSLEEGSYFYLDRWYVKKTSTTRILDGVISTNPLKTGLIYKLKRYKNLDYYSDNSKTIMYDLLIVTSHSE